LADPNPTHFSTYKYLIKTKHQKVFKVLLAHLQQVPPTQEEANFC
jgi:hypothetical protein